jgi:hypothetical protein
VKYIRRKEEKKDKKGFSFVSTLSKALKTHTKMMMKATLHRLCFACSPNK